MSKEKNKLIEKIALLEIRRSEIDLQIKKNALKLNQFKEEAKIWFNLD